MPLRKEVFNYRLSRARKIVENAFGILAQRFCIFNKHIPLNRCNTIRVVKACCVLLNYLRDQRKIPDTFADLNPEKLPYLTNKGAILNLERLNGYRSTQEARNIRDIVCDFFNAVGGSVSFQYRHIAEQCD